MPSAKKISRGTKVFEFQKQENTALPEQFTFQNTVAATKEFLEDTKATGLLVIQDDTIKYEEYFAGTVAVRSRGFWEFF